MIGIRLIQLIEAHSDELARGLVEKLQKSERVSDLRKVPYLEVKQRAFEIYHNLSEWLLSKTEADIERRYRAIGARRATQGVRFSHLVFAILAVKEHLWEFLDREGRVDRSLELHQELELFHCVDFFFDRAIYHAAVGHEQACAARAA